jgi:hypothetical protein
VGPADRRRTRRARSRSGRSDRPCQVVLRGFAAVCRWGRHGQPRHANCEGLASPEASAGHASTSRRVSYTRVFSGTSVARLSSCESGNETDVEQDEGDRDPRSARPSRAAVTHRGPADGHAGPTGLGAGRGASDLLHENGPKGGLALRCALTVRRPHRPHVRVEDTAETARTAFDGAFAKLERNLARNQDRDRESEAPSQEVLRRPTNDRRGTQRPGRRGQDARPRTRPRLIIGGAGQGRRFGGEQ